MKPVSVSHFRKNPSTYLAKVKAGLSFLLVSQGKVIARVEPVKPEDDWPLHLADLIACGIVKGPQKADSKDVERVDPSCSKVQYETQTRQPPTMQRRGRVHPPR